MTRDIITQENERSKKLNELLQGLHDLYKEDVASVVYLCYELDATQEQVAKALGMSRVRVAQLYPKTKKEESNGK